MSLQYHVCYLFAALVMVVVNSPPISALTLSKHDISGHLPLTATLLTLEEFIPLPVENSEPSFSDGTKWNGLSSVKANHVMQDRFVVPADTPFATKTQTNPSLPPPMLRADKPQMIRTEKPQITYENVKRDDWEIIEEREFEDSLIQS